MSNAKETAMAADLLLFRNGDIDEPGLWEAGYAAGKALNSYHVNVEEKEAELEQAFAKAGWGTPNHPAETFPSGAPDK